MTDPSLHIEMENGIAEIGGRFRGRVHRSGELDDLIDATNTRVRAIEIALRWFSQGRGLSSTKTIERVKFGVDSYGRANGEFDFRVPASAPISYRGSLFQIAWEITARVDVRWAIDRKTTVPLLVIPTGGWGTYRSPHPILVPNELARPREERG